MLCWAVTSLLVGLMVYMNGPGASSDAPVAESRLSNADEMSGRMLLGLAETFPDIRPMLVPQIAPWSSSDQPFQRLGYVVILSELSSPEAAIEALDALRTAVDEQTLEPVPEDYRELMGLVGTRLFAEAAGEPAEPLADLERDRLEDALGFLGRLLVLRAAEDDAALEPIEASLRRAAWGVLGVGIWFITMFLLGAVILLSFGVLLLMRRLPLHFSSGDTGTIYIETFTVWLLLFLGLNTLPAIIARAFQIPLPSLSLEFSLLLGLGTFFLSLIALFWPRLRGVPASRLRADIGLVPGRFVVEVLAGFVTYAMAIPLLLVGAIAAAILALLHTLIFGEPAQPSHPIQDTMGSGPVVIVLVYLVACVAAPIVEEIMFRGVLYRYLRDLSRNWIRFWSVTASALLSSFVFAVIHPQGIVFVPVLGALAVAFCIGREWRGSLVAPMVAHAVSNAVVMTLNVMLNA